MVSRFHVMATLQAARARALGFDMNVAKSWGLNRALFYAAAKHAWAEAKKLSHHYPVAPIIPEIEQSKRRHELEYKIGTEKAYLSEDARRGLRFRFGDEVQAPEDFDAKIKAHFNDWERAWNEAMEIVQHAGIQDLESQSRFFDRIYKPRRDSLAERWSAFPSPARKRKVA